MLSLDGYLLAETRTCTAKASAASKMPRVVAASDAILAAERAVQHATTWRVVGLACASSSDAFEDALRLRGDSDGRQMIVRASRPPPLL